MKKIHLNRIMTFTHPHWCDEECVGGARIKQEVDPDKHRLSYCVCDKVNKCQVIFCINR